MIYIVSISLKESGDMLQQMTLVVP